MYDARNIFAWLLLMFFAIMLMIIGVEGAAGKVLAVVFTPSILQIDESTSGVPFSTLNPESMPTSFNINQGSTPAGSYPFGNTGNAALAGGTQFV